MFNYVQRVNEYLNGICMYEWIGHEEINKSRYKQKYHS